MAIKMAMKQKIILYTDGGSRGNPGLAALGVVLKDEKEKTIASYQQTLGNRTNNEAEYEAVLFALKKVKQRYGKEKARLFRVELRLDSELVARQLQGTYKITEPRLHPLFMAIWNLRVELRDVRFVHVPRTKNKEADALVNEALDAQSPPVLF